MNRSYSKIRHIQESNMLLEKRKLIKEQDETDPFSDIYGKSVTFKDENTGIVIKGKIKGITEAKGFDDLFISLEDEYIVAGTSPTFYEGGERGRDIPRYKETEDSFAYGCGEGVFYKKLFNDETLETERIMTFTCEGLSDFLDNRLPCKTDFAMNDKNAGNSFS